MHSIIFLSILSAGAITLALPYSSEEPTTTTTINPFTNYPAAPTEAMDGLNLPKSNLTLPNNTTYPRISTRVSHYGWVGSFKAKDCTGDPVGPRPKVTDGGCVTFRPRTNNVGFDWGEWPLAFENINFFEDAHCKLYASPTISKPPSFNAKGANTCLQMGYNGGPWKSFSVTY